MLWEKFACIQNSVIFYSVNYNVIVIVYYIIYMSTSTHSPDSHVYSNQSCCCDVRGLVRKGNSLSAADFPSQNYYECKF